MFRLHFHRNLRSLAFVLVAGLLVSMPVGLWWANRTGLPESWRTAIEQEFGRHGMYVQIGGLSYLPLRGMAANDVVVYSDQTFAWEISRVESLLLGFDKTKLARGDFEITRLQVRNADLSLPVEEGNPGAGVLKIKNLNGTLLRPGGRRFEVRDTKGWIGGFEVEIHMRMIGYSPSDSAYESAESKDTRRKVLADVVEELTKWNFDRESPPRLKLWVEGDLNHSSSIRSRLVLESARMEKEGIALDNVYCEGEAAGGVLTVHRLTAADGRGELECRLDYDPWRKSGRFEGSSSLDVIPLLDAWFGVDAGAKSVLLGGRQEITGQGSFRVTEAGGVAVETMGRVKCGSVMLKGVSFDEVSGAFSWKNGSFFMRDAKLVRPDGVAHGKVMVEWPIVRLAVRSNMPAVVYGPLFRDQPLEKVIADFSAREGAVCEVDLEGGFDATDRFSWAYSGGASLKKMDYRGVPLTSVSCRMSLNHHELDFMDGKIRFDYRAYPMRVAFKGPASGDVEIGRVRYRNDDKVVDVERVTGDFWAAPMVRLFAPKTADVLEAYRFHTPPSLEGSGLVDVTPAGRTRLDVSFRSASAATMEFLEEDIVLSQPVGKVLIRGNRVEVSDLTATAFGGQMKAAVSVREGDQISGDISWTKLSLVELADTYGFSIKGGGDSTGRIEFDMRSGRVETMNGTGLLAVENTELFSVPMFGPLSHLISGVLQDKRAGFEQAKSAFCNYTIRNGVMETRDFTSTTRSLTFTGDGKVDMTDQTMNMTMRMNTHGLFSLITLPFRPFYGMFQFRGTGPIKQPTWENVMFTSPPAEQSEALGAPPRAREIR
jgi:hypothetical protein